MRTVKTKEELIKAIEDGERNIYVASKQLYAACYLAEKYDSATALLKDYGIKKLMANTTMNIVVTPTLVITITIAVLVAAIAIIGILKDKKVKIKCTKNEKGMLIGEIEII